MTYFLDSASWAGSPPGSFPSPRRNPGELDSQGMSWVSWSAGSAGGDSGSSLGLAGALVLQEASGPVKRS